MSRSLIQFDNTRDLANWYDQKYQDMGGGWKIPEEEAVRLIKWAGIKKDKTKSLLDIGCGQGHFVSIANRYVRAGGIDLSRVVIKMAKETFPEMAFEVDDIEMELPTEVLGVLDYLTSIGSIEHCIDMKTALENCHKLLKPNGKFLVLVPNELWVHMDQPQEQTHTDEEWEDIFNDAGFIVTKSNRHNDLTDFLLVKS